MHGIRGLLALLVPLSLVACNDNSYDGVSGPTANFQILHASPDAAEVSVLIDGQPALDEVHYGWGTGELLIPAGTHVVALQTQTPNGPTALGAPVTVNFQQDNDYVFVAEGTFANAVTDVFPHPLSPVAATSTRVQVLHAAPAAPAIAVYLTAPGASLAASTPLGTGSIAFMGSIGPSDIPSGPYEIRITPAGATTPVLFDSGTITLAGGTDLVITAMQNTGPGASPVFLSVVDATGYNSPLYDILTPANVRVVHASPDTPPISVSATINNSTTTLVSSLAYPMSTAYLPLGPGVYSFGIAAASNPSQALVTTPLTLNAGDEQTIYALGKLANLVTQVTFDDRRRLATQAKLRIVDGSPTAGNVDVYIASPGTSIASLSPSYTAVPFGGDTGFQGFVAGSYAVTVTAAGSKTPLVGPVNASLINTGVYTLVVRDAPGGGAPYGFISLDDFGP